MKKSLIYLISILCIAFTACEEVIDEIDFSNDKQLAVFGILNTAGTDNKIYCYYKNADKVEALSDAVVKIYINGELKETVSDNECNVNLNQYSYRLNSKFNPGDKVRLEVSSASANSSVWAETEVPMPVEVSGFDTLRTVTSLYNQEAEEYYRIALQLKNNADKPVNCRLLAGHQMDEICGLVSADYHTYEKLFDYPDSIATNRNVSLEVKEDPALTDGKGYVPVEDDEFISMETYYYNHYRMVGSQYFKNGAYTVSFYVRPQDWWDNPMWGKGYGSYYGDQEWLYKRKFRELWNYLDDDGEDEYYFDEEGYPHLIYKPRIILYEKNHEESIYYQIFAMSDEEYMYLHGRSNQIDLDWSESSFVEPVVLKSNINGGLGIFAIETVTEGTIKLKTPIRTVGDINYYGNNSQDSDF